MTCWSCIYPRNSHIIFPLFFSHEVYMPGYIYYIMYSLKYMHLCNKFAPSWHLTQWVFGNVLQSIKSISVCKQYWHFRVMLFPSVLLFPSSVTVVCSFVEYKATCGVAAPQGPRGVKTMCLELFFAIFVK